MIILYNKNIYNFIVLSDITKIILGKFNYYFYNFNNINKYKPH